MTVIKEFYSFFVVDAILSVFKRKYFKMTSNSRRKTIDWGRIR